MATLLAYLGPPEHRAVDTQFLVRNKIAFFVHNFVLARFKINAK
jgi:hypothetical protein